MSTFGLSIDPPERPAPAGDVAGDELGPLGPLPEGDIFDVGLDDVDAPPVDEARIRSLLTQSGRIAHRAAGDPDVVDHWRFTAEELDAIAPPLTAIVNRRPALRRLAAKGDGLFLALAVAEYVAHNIEAGRAARVAREDRDDRPRATDRPFFGRQGGGADAGDPPSGNGGDRPGDDQPPGPGVGPYEVDGIGDFAG